MNRFTDLTKELEEKAKSLDRLLPDLDKLDREAGTKEPDRQFRLPYSSDPKRVDKRWK